MSKGCGWRQVTNVVTRFCPPQRLGLCCLPMRGMLFTLIWVACSVASATQVYKWVDENGVTHYSDQPHENAAKVDVHEPQTYSPQRGLPVPPTQQQSTTDEKEPGAYASCTLVQPTPDQVFLSVYSITVTVNAVPALRSGDRVVVTLDGRPRTDLAGGTSITLPIDRGTHSVEATIQDSSGKAVCQTASATFHVRQASVLGPLHPRP